MAFRDLFVQFRGFAGDRPIQSGCYAHSGERQAHQRLGSRRAERLPSLPDQAPRPEGIPHRKVGEHRRIRMEDVIAYKNAIDRECEQVLEQLTREAQTRDMEYGAR